MGAHHLPPDVHAALSLPLPAWALGGYHPPHSPPTIPPPRRPDPGEKVAKTLKLS